MILSGTLSSTHQSTGHLGKEGFAPEMVELSAKNLTSNAGLFLLLERARRNGIVDLIGHDLVFET